MLLYPARGDKPLGSVAEVARLRVCLDPKSGDFGYALASASVWPPRTRRA